MIKCDLIKFGLSRGSGSCGFKDGQASEYGQPRGLDGQGVAFGAPSRFQDSLHFPIREAGARGRRGRQADSN